MACNEACYSPRSPHKRHAKLKFSLEYSALFSAKLGCTYTASSPPISDQKQCSLTGGRQWRRDGLKHRCSCSPRGSDDRIYGRTYRTTWSDIIAGLGVAQLTTYWQCLDRGGRIIKHVEQKLPLQFASSAILTIIWHLSYTHSVQ